MLKYWENNYNNQKAESLVSVKCKAQFIPGLLLIPPDSVSKAQLNLLE